MLYTEEDVYSYVEQEDVKFIRLAFCDISGRQKNISIMPQELKRAFSQGISFDASAIGGFGGVVESDLFLFPIPSTLSLMPWRPSRGKVVRMFCRIRYPDGRPFPLDCRAGPSERLRIWGFPCKSERNSNSTSSKPMWTATPPPSPSTTRATWTWPRRTRGRTSAGRSA